MTPQHHGDSAVTTQAHSAPMHTRVPREVPRGLTFAPPKSTTPEPSRAPTHLAKTLSTNGIQAKLKINERGGDHEREADEVADRVMGDAADGVPTADTCCSACAADAQCSKPANKSEFVHRNAIGGPGLRPELPPGTEAKIRSGASDGEPLPAPTREFFEPRFGRNLSDVQLHTGPRAAQLAGDLGAHAFTHNRHVWLGAAIGSEPSHVLAHELTHVLQQTDSRSGGRTNVARVREVVQRDSIFGSPGFAFGEPAAQADNLAFSERIFIDQSLPTVCPRCHRDKPTIPMPPRFKDREATPTRLFAWGTESEKMLHNNFTVRQLQLDPEALDRIVDDYGVGLIKRITSSHEFTGSDPARDKGADVVRANWPEMRLIVREKCWNYYQTEFATAVALTPKDASPVLQPSAIQMVLAAHHGAAVDLGRWGATAKSGDRVGNFIIHDADGSRIWFTLVDWPMWLYEIGAMSLVKSHDPFTAEVSRQVYENTKWILHLMPFLLKVAAFGLGFSGNVALIISGILLDEFAEEMKADAEGRPGRTITEIVESAGIQFLVDRIFHGLLGGGAGKAAKAVSTGGRYAARLERVAEKAAPAIRNELVAAEKPLVKDALEAGTARRVTEGTAKAEGHTVEVAVESASERHLFRLNEKTGRWCRYSSPICDLDLGQDVVAAAHSPKSFTVGALEDTRTLMSQVTGEITFLGGVYRRMQKAGNMEISLLSAEERTLLDELAPSGDAATLTLRELRDLPARLGLKRDFATAAAKETQLVQQLYREGRPLYEVMRSASPSFASRTKVLADAARRDAATGLAPRSGALAVDHIVPLNDIITIKGFTELRPERQLMIVNDVKNLRAIDALANSSRGDRSWWFWNQALIHYDAKAIAKMRTLEDEMRTYLQNEIQRLLRP